MTAAALLVAACGGSGETSESSSSAATSSASATGTSAEQTGVPHLPDGLTIDVIIDGGQVTPTNAQLQGKVGEPIVLRVTSDVADELHVHSVPDHTFPVEAKPDQRFEFTADVPGNVDIELHDLNRVVASVQIRP